MSVVTMYLEEFPEHALCGSAFHYAAAASPSCVNKARATPSCDVVTMEDPYQPRSSFVAAKELAAAADMLASNVTSCVHSRTMITSAPQSAYYTTEDGGQSEGASRTSARAAMLLATLELIEEQDDDDASEPTPINGRTTGRYARQGYCAPVCAC